MLLVGPFPTSFFVDPPQRPSSSSSLEQHSSNPSSGSSIGRLELNGLVVLEVEQG